MRAYDPNVLSQLEKGGWTSSREIDISRFLPVLKQEHGPIRKRVKNFLASYGGLGFLPNTGDYFHFDPIEAIENIDVDWIRLEYRQRVGKKLYTIGEAFNGHIVLCMSEKGEIYGGIDNELFYIGSDEQQAIEALCLHHTLSPVLESAENLTTQLEASIEAIVSAFENISEIDGQSIKPIINDLEPSLQNKYFTYRYKYSTSTDECLSDLTSQIIPVKTHSSVLLFGIYPAGKRANKNYVQNYIIKHLKENGIFFNSDLVCSREIPKKNHAMIAFVEVFS